MENSWVHAPVKPEYLGIQSGCAAILDCLGYNLANPNDSVIIPGPIYPGFKKDLEKRP